MNTKTSKTKKPTPARPHINQGFSRFDKAVMYTVIFAALVTLLVVVVR